VLAVGNDAQFSRFCGIATRPDLARDPRFATNDARVRHRDACIAALDPVLRSRTAADWLAALGAAGIPCAPVNDLAEVFASPQAVARQLRIDLPHPTAGTVPLVASPMRFSATPVTYDAAPPLLGQHTDAILREHLGLSEAAIAALRAAGVV
jgi:crotonobetainyl-CoA:carnitine CoA-transferase CaiB-like acyl-CoA transferase